MYTHCFAYDPTRKTCTALHNSSDCGYSCPFCKSRADFDAGQRRTHRRLAGLPEWQQQYISETYYHGYRPWMGQGARGGGGA